MGGWQATGRRWAGERGANVAQATAVAIVAAAMLGVLVLFAPRLGAAVDTQFGCLVGVLSGGGAECAAQAEPAPERESDVPAGPESCDLRCQMIGFLKGFGEGLWDTLVGLFSLGKDLLLLIAGDDETWAKYEQLVQAFMADPVGVAKALLGELAAPILEDWEAGRYGEATGRLLYEVISTIGGPKALDKLGKLGKLDDLGDVGKITKPIPCLGARPVGRAPGLAKPLAESCGIATKLRNSPGTVTTPGNLPDVPAGQRWLQNPTGDGIEGRIPGQIARKLEGRTFDTFDDFREAFWKEVANDTNLADDFTPQNLERMRDGYAPFVPRDEQYGKLRRFVLHHDTPIQHGGPVYDLDNIRIVSPRRHQNILDPTYHFGNGD